MFESKVLSLHISILVLFLFNLILYSLKLSFIFVSVLAESSSLSVITATSFTKRNICISKTFIFIPPIFSSLNFFRAFSMYNLNNMGNNLHPCLTPFYNFAFSNDLLYFFINTTFSLTYTF